MNGASTWKEDCNNKRRDVMGEFGRKSKMTKSRK